MQEIKVTDTFKWQKQLVPSSHIDMGGRKEKTSIWTHNANREKQIYIHYLINEQAKQETMHTARKNIKAIAP